MGPGPFSLVIPTLNEIETLPRLVGELDTVISENASLLLSEVVFVDDGSTDGTIAFLEQLRESRPEFRVRVITRNIRHGPAHAELHGIRNAQSDLVVKLDADGQHSLKILPMLLEASTGDVDVVVASRYMRAGGTSWPPVRGLISRSARLLSYLMIPAARQLSDPISGYFLMRRSLVLQLKRDLPRFKLLLYVLAVKPGIRAKEIPFTMGHRIAGESKVIGTSVSYVIGFLTELINYWRESMRSSNSGQQSTSQRSRVSSDKTQQDARLE